MKTIIKTNVDVFNVSSILNEMKNEFIVNGYSVSSLDLPFMFELILDDGKVLFYYESNCIYQEVLENEK